MTAAVTGGAAPDRALEGRVALVTGAASGIGRACAVRLAKDGARVIAVDWDADGLAALAADVPGLEVRVADLTDGAAIAALPAEVDVLVNNAGVQHVAPVEDFPTEVFERIHRLMLWAPFALIRQSVPHMYGQGWGRIVNVSSVHGLRASAFKSAYVSAKHGLEGLSKTVALEAGGKGVTSNCVNPAYVRTPLVEKQIADQAKVHGITEAEVVSTIMLEPVAVKRLVEPEEVADLVAWLCGPSSASVTGSAFVMDGGWTAH